MQRKTTEKNNLNSNKKIKDFRIIFVFVIIIIIILCIFLYSNIIDYISTYEKREVYAQVIVSDNFGIAINGTALIFGMTKPGGHSEKDIQLENNYNHDVRFKIYTEGNISDFLIVSENNFILKPGESKTLTFTVNIPGSAAFGTYSGKVFFVARNPSVK
jgi:hypothetical protein